MTWQLLQLLALVYLGGLWWMHQRNWGLLYYSWGALGFAFLFIHVSLLQGLNNELSAIEAQQVQGIMGWFGVQIQIVDQSTMFVPDSTGWSALVVGIECSTLIEMGVLVGLIMFYPRLSLQQRWTYLGIGIVGTYLLNLLRLLVIVVMILIWGKPVVLLAHAIVARLVYFAGIVTLYWFLLTKPTLSLVRRSIEISGRAAH
jgi:exosortase/archaeosortase family protein